MPKKNDGGCISIFRPGSMAMRNRVRIIGLILAVWMLAIIAIQFYVYRLETSYSGLLLNDVTIFNLPVHFWLTGHFLPLFFIILCAAFNFWMDRHSLHNPDGSLRFRINGDNRDTED